MTGETVVLAGTGAADGSLYGGTMSLPSAATQQQGDSARVRKWLLALVNDCKNRAEEVTAKHVWESIDAENKAYGLRDKTLNPQDAGIKAAAQEQSYEVQTKDLADQVDEMTALLSEMFASGEIRKLVPRENITEKEAELMQKVQDALLNEKGFRQELRRAVGRYVRNCVAGFKVCRSRETQYATEMVNVPAEMFNDGILMAMGFGPEQLEDGSALASVLADQGLMLVGKADEQENGDFTQLLCWKCREIEQHYVYAEAINPRRIAIVDPTRPINKQPSIHEYHYLTAKELRRVGFNKNRVKELVAKGREIKDTNQQNPKSASATGGMVSGRLETPVYEVNESWLEVDWASGIESNSFTDGDLRAFTTEEGFPGELCRYECFKWRVWHSKGDSLLAVEPNYLKDKSEYPFDAESFVDADGEYRGNSMLERMSNVAANMLAFLNMTARAVKRNLYLPTLVSDRLGLTPDDLKKLQNNGGYMRVASTLESMQDHIHTWQVPDVTNMGLTMARMFEDKLRGLGVPSILAGEGQADTATQDSINNRRGQTVVNDAFGRFMAMLVRTYTKHLGAVLETFTAGRYIHIVGEDGMTMNRRWVRPSELTDELDIVPLVKFNEGEKQRMAQFLMGTANIVAASNPNSVMEIVKISWELMGVDQTYIDRITKAAGSYTNVQQEIQAMLLDPDMHIEARPEDPHPVCIMAAQIALQQDVAKAQAMGFAPIPRDNIMEYIQMHTALQQQQDMMAQMQQLMAVGGPEQQGEPKGKPKQGRADGGPGNDEGEARQNGQAVGAGNKGILSAAGLTGQGSVGLVKGAPAGV